MKKKTTTTHIRQSVNVLKSIVLHVFAHAKKVSKRITFLDCHFSIIYPIDLL